MVVDDTLESTKDYDDLATPSELGIYLNKKMKCVNSFKRAEGYPNGENIYMNTYRNGFVSALAMAYNFHLPLIIDPRDIWLTVMQGFKIHVGLNKDKEFIKLSFKNLKKLNATTKKHLSLNEKPGLTDEEFSSMLTESIDKAIHKIWNDKHTSKDFISPVNKNLLPVDKLTDMFYFKLTSEYDL